MYARGSVLQFTPVDSTLNLRVHVAVYRAGTATLLHLPLIGWAVVVQSVDEPALTRVEPLVLDPDGNTVTITDIRDQLDKGDWATWQLER